MVHKNLERFRYNFQSTELIIAKAGYHHHGDTLPLLVYRSE